MTDDKRLQKAQELHANGVTPVETGPNKWSVGSERDSTTTYEVENLDGMWICECADFAFRGGLCKHIILSAHVWCNQRKHWSNLRKKKAASGICLAEGAP